PLATAAQRLRHTHVSAKQLEALTLPEGVAELYRALCAEAGPVAARDTTTPGEPLAPRLFARTLRVEDSLDRLADRVRELEQQLGERDAKIGHLEQYTADM